MFINKRKSRRAKANTEVRRRLLFEGLETRRLMAVAEMVEDVFSSRGVNNLLNNSSAPAAITQIGNLGYFAAYDNTNGTELWRINAQGLAELVANIATTSQSSDPEQFTNVNGMLYFVARSTTSGKELWRIRNDGVADIVGDIHPGSVSSNPSQLTNVAGTLYFSATDGTNGDELWKINALGNPVIVEDSLAGGGLSPGAESSTPSLLTNVSGTLFFSAGGSTIGREVWKVNNLGVAELIEGSISGGGIRPGGASALFVDAVFENVNGTLYFKANDGVNGDELWRINPSGITEMVEDNVVGGGIRPGVASSFPALLTNVGGTLFFTANDGLNGAELWRINASGIAEMIEDSIPGDGIGPLGLGADIASLTSNLGTLYFAANDLTNSLELWRVNSNGIAEIVEDSILGGGIAESNHASSPFNLQSLAGTLFFTANNSMDGREFWKVNSSGIAEMIEDSIPGGGIGPGANYATLPHYSLITEVSGTVYLAANDILNGNELWRLNSLGIAERVDDAATGIGIAPSTLNAIERTTQFFSNLNGTLYFSANDHTNGIELWRVNSAGVAEMVEDSVPGDGINSRLASATPANPTEVNGFIYFVVNDGTNGTELWRIDPTGSATIVDKGYQGEGIQPGPNGSNPSNLVNLNGTLYFAASDGTNGRELWRINSFGLAEMIEDAVPGNGINSGSSSDSIIDAFDSLNPPIVPGFLNPEANLTEVNGTVYFRAYSGSVGVELWRINSMGQAELVEDSIPGGGIATSGSNSNPNQLFNANGTLYFVAYTASAGKELWRVNNAGIAELVEDSVPGSGLNSAFFNSSSPAHFTLSNNTFYFTADNGVDGRELWKINADGNAQIVEDSIVGGGINAGASGSMPQATITSGADVLPTINLLDVSGTLYFAAIDNINGTELWRVRSNGIAELVEDNIPGFGIGAGAASSLTLTSSTPNLTNVGGTLYFSANDGTNGNELWRVLPTGIAEMVNRSSTQPGINEGPANALSASSNSTRQSLTNVSGTLYFVANDGTNGYEVWRTNSAGFVEMVDDAIADGGIATGALNSSPTNLTNAGGQLMFRANDGTNGFELWRVNNAGIAILVDDSVEGPGIRPGSSSSVSFAYLFPGSSNLFVQHINGYTYFNANDGTNGVELWRIESNQTPTNVMLSATSVPENQPLNTTIGVFSTIDANRNDRFTYSLVTGNGDADNSSFLIQGNTLRSNSVFDFEAKSLYTIRIRTTDADGEFFESPFWISIENVTSSITNRRVFYKNSNSIFANGAQNPDTLIDPSKSALLPGQSASFANYTNYSRGLNGLIVDVSNASPLVTEADFQFAIWNGVGVSGFTPTSATARVSLISNGGLNGSTRFKIEFTDNAIRNTWLRVTMLANTRTDLASNNVFYFGNAVGDVNVGNTGAPMTVQVNEADTQAIRQFQALGNTNVSISTVFDLNKDGLVNSIDVGIVRQNQASRLIRMFNAPVTLRFSPFTLDLNRVGVTTTPIVPSKVLNENEVQIVNSLPLQPLSTNSTSILSKPVGLRSLRLSSLQTAATNSEADSLRLKALDAFFSQR